MLCWMNAFVRHEAGYRFINVSLSSPPSSPHPALLCPSFPLPSSLLVHVCLSTLNSAALRPLFARFRSIPLTHMTSATNAFIPLPPAREIPSTFVASVKSW